MGIFPCCLVPFAYMSSPLSRHVRWKLFACTLLLFGLPESMAGRHLYHGFQACSVFTHVTAYMLAESPSRPSYNGRFSGVVTFTTAPIASGWNQFPGGNCIHCRSNAVRGAHGPSHSPK